MRGFIPITKVDQENRMVYAVMASETPDRDNEVCDYDSSAPLIREWSEEMHKASGGKSFGNVRAMHNRALVAAGKVTQLECDDESKCVNVALKIVDDQEWNKVLEGLYTGVSLGGKCKRRWQDSVNKALTRYTVKPFELTLADYPCNPDSTFLLTKLNGETEERMFKSAGEDRDYHGRWTAGALEDARGDKASQAFLASDKADEQAGNVKYFDHGDSERLSVKAAADTEKAGSSGTNDLHLKAATSHEMAAEAHTKAAGDERQERASRTAHRRAASAHLQAARAHRQVAKLPESVEKIAARPGVNPEEGESKYGDVEYADEKNKKYPIDAKHVKAAWSYINHPKNAGKYSPADLATMKAKIRAAYKKHLGKEPGDAEKLLKLVGTRVNDIYKGMCTVGMFANLVDKLDQLKQAIECEEECELDGSPIPEDLCGPLTEVADLLCDYTSEEVGELLARLFEDKPTGVQTMQVKLAGADPLTADDVSKTGARHSKADLDHLNQAHHHAHEIKSHLEAMGAEPEGDAQEEEEKITKFMADHESNVTKLQAENEDLQKMVTDLTDGLAKATAELERVNKIIVPGGPAKMDVGKVVTKTEDNGGTAKTAEELKAEDIKKFGGDPDKDPSAAIKKSWASGGQVVLPGAPIPQRVT